MNFRVYLAGGISGLGWGSATDWRREVSDKLSDLSKGRIAAYSPLRGKEYLQGEKEISDCYSINESSGLSVLSTEQGITARDRHDVMTSDAIFVNLLGATRVSIGTMFEVAWADLRRIPIILVMEREGNPHEHSMLRQMCPLRVSTLEEGVLLTARVLLP